MPIALYETDINTGDTVKLIAASDHYKKYGEQIGIVESVMLNVAGYWEVQVHFGDKGIVVESRQLERCAP